MARCNININESVGKIYHRTKQSVISLWCLVMTLPALALADTIPMPPDSEQIGEGGDFLDVLYYLLGNKIGPLMIYGASIFLVAKAIFTVMNGVKEAQRRDDWGEMKSSVIAAGVMVTVGLLLAYTGHEIFSGMVDDADNDV